MTLAQIGASPLCSLWPLPKASPRWAGSASTQLGRWASGLYSQLSRFCTFAPAANIVLAAAHCSDGQLSVLLVYIKCSKSANELHAQGLELTLVTAPTSAPISALRLDLDIAASSLGNGQLIALDSGPPSPLNNWASIPVDGIRDDCPALSDIGDDLGEGSL